MKKPELNPENAFIDLCEKGDLAGIKKLLTTHTETDICFGNNHGLIQAVIKNYLPVVEYLLENTRLGQEISIYQEQSAYLVACDRGTAQCVKLFFKNWLNNPSQQKSNPQIWEYGFTSSYLDKNVQVMKLFLEDPIMKPYANIHLENDHCFIYFYQIERKDLLEMLILEYNIDMTDSIKDFLNNPDIKKDILGNKYKIDKEELKDLFEKRDFKNKLEDLHPEKHSKSKSRKI